MIEEKIIVAPQDAAAAVSSASQRIRLTDDNSYEFMEDASGVFDHFVDDTGGADTLEISLSFFIPITFRDTHGPA